MPDEPEAQSAPTAPLGVVLALAMAMGSLAVYSVSALAPFILDDLALRPSHIGMFSSTLFIVSAAIAPVAGRYADGSDSRRLLATLFVLTGLTSLALATSRNLPHLLMVGALAGLPMALANVATTRIIRAHAKAERYGWLSGVNQAGVKLGQLASGAAFPIAATALGWRLTVAAGASFALVGLFLGLRVVGRSASIPDRSEVKTRIPTDAARYVKILTAYCFLMGVGQASSGSYIALYGFEEVGMTAVAAGLGASAMGGAGLVARVAWSNRIGRTSNLMTPLVLISAGSAVSALILLAAANQSPFSFYSGSVLLGATSAVWNVVIAVGIMRYLPKALVGRASAWVFVGFSTGFVIGPLTFGILVERTLGYSTSWLFVFLAFTLATVLSMYFTIKEAPVV